MIRRCNYTGRKKISHTEVAIKIESGTERNLSVEWSFPNLSVPPQAPVVIEAYTGGSLDLLRFDWGQVGVPIPPTRRSLAELPGQQFLFNLKVLDPSPGNEGRILAIARGIRPGGRGPEGAKRTEELLVVNPRNDMGQEVWSLTFDNGAVWLNVNASVVDFEGTVAGRTDTRFFALVYPEVVRQVLGRAIRESEGETPEGWCAKWFCWAKMTLGGELPKLGLEEGETDFSPEQRAWLDQMVRRFCEDKQALSKWNNLETQS